MPKLNKIPIANLHESPSEYADRLGVYYTNSVKSAHKKELGQYFTSLEVAKYMATFFDIKKNNIKILDPGFGMGILTTAVTERIASLESGIVNIELIAFETDIDILPLAEKCLNYLRNWLEKKNINFSFFLCKNDFVLHNSEVLSNKEHLNETYDLIISNPPYFKLPADDERAIAAKKVIYGQTNIYSIFLLIAAKLLNKNGQLVFITPRSFCSGSYFRLFREIFFSIINLKKIHLFESRKQAFKRDNVLQENIIVLATKKEVSDLEYKKPENIRNTEIQISISSGITDLKTFKQKKYKINDIINFDTYQKILHLPVSDLDEKIIRIFKTWTGSLNAYDLEISTGKVVDFRSKEFISIKKHKDSVPLIWLHNIGTMSFIWPKMNNSRGKEKGQYINNCIASKSRLIRNQNYIFLRRFSSKDDKRRLIATPYFSKLQKNYSAIGVENHLNYIYATKTNLSIELTNGIAAILNSQLFDLYFRTFNGNINVSATELRDFPLPDLPLILLLGQKVGLLKGNNKMQNIDDLVAEIFNLDIDLKKVYA